MSAPPSFAETARAVRAAVPVATLAASLGIRLTRDRGPCPICGTSSTSQAFSVRNDRWRCFACGERGDAVDLIRVMRGCSPREALTELVRQAGIDPTKPVSAHLRRQMALEDVRRRTAHLTARRLTRFALEAGRFERLADLDAEAAGVAWRLGLSGQAIGLAAASHRDRERAERLDRDAERIAEELDRCRT